MTKTNVRAVLLAMAFAQVLPAWSAGITPAGKEFLDTHCSACHDPDAKKGGFSLDQLDPQHAGPDQMELMTRMFDRTLIGEMPPKQKTPPPPEEKKAFLQELGATLLAKDTELAGESSRTSVRRMNRVEYENTLRDLLGLPLLRITDKLPEDGQKFGFDKVAEALDISHVQMTKYLEAADLALRQARVPEPQQPESKTWRELASQQGTMRSTIAVHCAVPLKGHEIAPGLTTSLVGNPKDDPGNTYRAAHFDGDAESVAVLTGVIGAHQPEGIQIDRFNQSLSFTSGGVMIPAERSAAEVFKALFVAGDAAAIERQDSPAAPGR